MTAPGPKAVPDVPAEQDAPLPAVQVDELDQLQGQVQILSQNLADMSKQSGTYVAAASKLQRELGDARRQIVGLERLVADRDVEIEALRQRLAARDIGDRAAELRDELSEPGPLPPGETPAPGPATAEQPTADAT